MRDASATADEPKAPVKAAARSLPSKVVILTILLLLAVVGIPWVVVSAFREPPPTSRELFEKSLEELKAGHYAESLKYIRPLQKEGYLDTNFSGGVDYIIGMIAFHDAELMEGANQQRMYQMAISYLREAERKAILEDYFADWSFALGKSLYQVNRTLEAFDVLQNAYDANTQMRPTIGLMLSTLYLNPNTKPHAQQTFGERMRWKLNRAGELVDEALSSGQLTPAQLVEAFEAKTQVAILNREFPTAEQALSEFQSWQEKFRRSEVEGNIDLRSKAEMSRVHRGRLAMAGGNFSGALTIFDEVLRDYPGLENPFTRMACLFTGQCYQQLGDFDAAIRHYERVMAAAESDEALIATLENADLLRTVKLQHEKALELYRQMLKRIDEPEAFNNQWMALEQIQDRIRTVWDQWTASGVEEAENYKWAIVLSESMVPLFKTAYAHELTALANVRWAEQIHAQYLRSSISQRVALSGGLRERWLAAGHAYANLATARRSEPDYPSAVWQAAQTYLKANDFPNALKMLDEFLASRPEELLPTAMVRKAEILIHLNPYVQNSLLPEAEETLVSVVSKYKKDPISFRAQFLLGQVALEQNQTEKAVSIWRELLISNELTPDAEEWELALLNLGRTLYHTSESMLVTERTQAVQSTRVKAPQQEVPLGYQMLKEAIGRLEEYLLRYPNHEPSHEARWMLAKALSRYSDFTLWQLAGAETINARLELIRELRTLQEDSIAQYNALKLTLGPLRPLDLLDDSLHKILRDAYFEPGHAEFVLGEFDESGQTYRKAIATYGQAINQFPNDPQVVLAYYQIAHCYDRLNRPDEAVRQLQRAKVILQSFSEDLFTKESTNYTLSEWRGILDQAIEVHRLTQATAMQNSS